MGLKDTATVRRYKTILFLSLSYQLSLLLLFPLVYMFLHWQNSKFQPDNIIRLFDGDIHEKYL